MAGQSLLESLLERGNRGLSYNTYQVVVAPLSSVCFCSVAWVWHISLDAWELDQELDYKFQHQWKWESKGDLACGPTPASGYSESEAKVTTSMGPFFGHFQAAIAAELWLPNTNWKRRPCDSMWWRITNLTALSNLCATVYQESIQYDTTLLLNQLPYSLPSPPIHFFREIFFIDFCNGFLLHFWMFSPAFVYNSVSSSVAISSQVIQSEYYCCRCRFVNTTRLLVPFSGSLPRLFISNYHLWGISVKLYHYQMLLIYSS